MKPAPPEVVAFVGLLCMLGGVIIGAALTKLFAPPHDACPRCRGRGAVAFFPIGGDGPNTKAWRACHLCGGRGKVAGR